LPLGATVNVDDHRALAVELGGWTIKKPADALAVPTLPVNQLWLGKIGRIESAGFAISPALQFSALCVERVHIRGGPGRNQVESQFAVVLCPLHSRDDALGEACNGLLFPGLGVEQVQHAITIFVGDESDGLAVIGQIEFLNVPRNLAREVSMLFAGQVDVSQAVELRVFVGAGIDSLAVLAELASRIRNLLGTFRSQ